MLDFFLLESVSTSMADCIMISNCLLLPLFCIGGFTWLGTLLCDLHCLSVGETHLVGQKVHLSFPIRCLCFSKDVCVFP